jgi:glycosyltransferase involved in cell wall biosynthesis
MKVLVVCSGNTEKFDFTIHQAFIFEQIEVIKQNFCIEYDTFFIKGKGVLGYLLNLPRLQNKIKSFAPEIIHAHFGLSGLFACLQRKTPVVITFHGSDGNVLQIRLLSKIAAAISQFNIFVSDRIQKLIKENKRYSIIPCGINLAVFYPIDMKVARDKLNLKPEKRYILFSSSFTNSVKNAALAFSAVQLLKMECELIELKNKSRNEVNLLLNACNLTLLTSKSEGSPQIIKEAMACNCPIVATDVGDIKKVIGETEGCHITSFDPSDVARKITLALQLNERTNGREKIIHFDNKLIAEKVYKVYKKLTEAKDDYNN